MKKEKTPQENASILHEVHDHGAQPKEYQSEEKLLHKSNLREQSPVHISSGFLSESAYREISLKCAATISTSPSTGLTVSNVPKSSRSSSTNFFKTDNTSSSSTSVPVLPKPHFAVLTPQSSVLGEGEDYFNSLFFDSKRRFTHSEFLDRNKILPPDEDHTSRSRVEYNDSECSLSRKEKQAFGCALGDLKIVEVSANGLFVKLFNCSNNELAIGDHILQQNVNGHAVSLYKFHPNIRMAANTTVTVWAGTSEMKQKPPSDFVWKEQDKFKTSPNCTTILCNPDGQAIAWYTPIHWKQAWEGIDTEKKHDRSPVIITSPKVQMIQESESALSKGKTDQPSPSILEEHVRVFLKREKELPPSLFPNRSPWCHSPDHPIHPNYSAQRPATIGNDGSTMGRQTRSQSARPDPILVPYSLSTGTRRNKTMNTVHQNHKSGRRSVPSSGVNLCKSHYIW
ncbi:lamin tail domain-containing protein 1 [Gracilinanus agilis]|uniref:lamin tail domain-containing protein 1 n=1 Tax=Gracilinanus agilis TaxID=191870 RepID=UPI001CFD5B74|nr:lamin tail domain-containing protein 1 [Gracilinanus agilis]